MLKAEEELMMRDLVAVEVQRFVSPRNLFIVGIVVVALALSSVAVALHTWNKVQVHDVYITTLKADVIALETVSRFTEALDKLNRNMEILAAGQPMEDGKEGSPVGVADK